MIKSKRVINLLKTELFFTTFLQINKIALQNFYLEKKSISKQLIYGNALNYETKVLQKPDLYAFQMNLITALLIILF